VKRWDYWAVMSPRELAMVLVADVDYLGVALASVLDLESGARRERVAVRPFGIGCRLPPVAGEPVRFRGLGLAIDVAGTAPTTIRARGRGLELDFAITPPDGYQPLDVRVPFGGGRAQFTSKRAGMPARGRLVVDGVERALEQPAFATLDFGRGRWPRRTRWNWAAAAGISDGRTLALNLGGQWTDGTGANENGFWIDGRLHRIGEDVRFRRDGDGWRIDSESGRVALAFERRQRRKVGVELGVVGARLDWSAGRFLGKLGDGTTEIAADGLTGWVEELDARW
jgi:hypothetical protein